MPAVELGPLGIRSNAIAPGPIDGTEGMLRLSRSSKDETLKMFHYKEWVLLKILLMVQFICFLRLLLMSLVMFVDGGSWQVSSGVGAKDYPVTLLNAINAPKGGKL